jgi:dihydroneopterin aldolase
MQSFYSGLSFDESGLRVAIKRQDRLALMGIKIRPRIGVTPGERRFPQACSADIVLWGNFEAAAATDDLSSALDYSRILAKVLEAADGREYNLVETLAYRLGRVVLENFPVERVTVKVRKQPASLADRLDHVEIEVEQS